MSYNYITSKNSPNYTSAADTPRFYGMARVIEGITIHHWGDPNQNPQFDNIVNYLCRANGNTSAHYVATGTDRKVACIVSPSDTAWHAGTAWGNARTIGIECDPRARDEDYDVVAELVADIRDAYGDVPIYWHSYFVATACPGAWNPERLDALSYTKFSAAEWGQGGNKTAPAPTPPPVVEPIPAKELYKLSVDGKQVAAYSSDVNAYGGYVYYGNKGTITLAGKDVTAEVLAKFTAPSPTTPTPGTGVPVIDQPDYSQENNSLLKWIVAIIKKIFNIKE